MRLYFKTVDMMAKYRNALGLLAASLSIDADESLNVALIIQTVRVLPIGCDAASSGERDQVVLDYLTTGSVAGSIGFWSCNNWSWAGESNMEDFGYNALPPRQLRTASDRSLQPRQHPHLLLILRQQRGCVYDFRIAPNPYGLVGFLEHGRKGRHWDENMDLIAERREVEDG
ncbi:hypothetical protein E4T46_08922 [Aureobasidium subglaciale]|nr:hypothetical protein E4T40_08929 [Aureobasidium subglaciale]KAI5217375.1 hypothetical protein E4T41_08888 [Aureobasidium subglaciale]KAI5255037.1 hypothetical protein E4T46_08922 [Aureobasidium subglaciale]